jgi:hypothetical protein
MGGMIKPEHRVARLGRVETGGNAQGKARTRNMFASIVCSIAAVPSPLGSNTNSDEGKI